VIADGLILHSEGVASGYGDAKILHGVNIKVEKGAFVTVMGPNGSGKSTLLKTVVGLVRHQAGATTIRGRDGQAVDITRARPYTLGALGLSYVPQMANVFTDMSVLENLQLASLSVLGGRQAFQGRLETVLEYFPVVRERLSSRAGTLSGGQRQMLAMARALIPDPVLLLLDEPSAGLQPDLVDTVFNKIREFSTLGLSVLMVEQKARQALEFSDYAYVLEMGRNRFEGAGPALAADPKIIDLYLGAGRLPDLADEENDDETKRDE
jgi:ABC-type branched-subunit amino acid transport system ATPase component